MEAWVAWFHERSSGSVVKAVAETAEALGFDGVALADHIALPKEQKARHPVMGTPFDPLTPNLDPFTVAATMGAVSSHLRFMTYSLVSGMRNPFTIARQAGSLAELTSGRFNLGITPGWNTDEMELLGHDPKTRGKRFDEALDVIRGLWREDLFSFKGEHYSFEEVGVCPRPTVPPPILIGGDSPKSFHRAARFDGWIGMTMSTDEVAKVAEIVRRDDADKRIYLIASEPMTDDYVERVEAAGVDGLVHMLWPPASAEREEAEPKCEAMRDFAKRWLSTR